MVGIVLASHGDLAQGIKQTASMVFGDQPDVVSVSLQPSMGPDDLRAEIEKEVATLSDQEQVLFLVELWGEHAASTRSTVCSTGIPRGLPTGMNLPMVITAYTLRMNPEATAHEIATGLIQESRDGVRVKPESLKPEAPKAVEALRPTRTAPSPRERFWAMATSSSCSAAWTPACCTARWQPLGPSRPVLLTASSWFPTPSLMTSCARP